MERTKAQIVDPSPFQGDKLLDDIDYLRGIEDTFYGLAVNHRSKITSL